MLDPVHAGIDRPAHRVGRVAVRRNRQAGLVGEPDREVQQGAGISATAGSVPGVSPPPETITLTMPAPAATRASIAGGDVGLGRDLAAPEVAVAAAARDRRAGPDDPGQRPRVCSAAAARNPAMSVERGAEVDQRRHAGRQRALGVGKGHGDAFGLARAQVRLARGRPRVEEQVRVGVDEPGSPYEPHRPCVILAR